MSTRLPAILRLAHCSPLNWPKQGHLASMSAVPSVYSHSSAAYRNECRYKTEGIRRGLHDIDDS